MSSGYFPLEKDDEHHGMLVQAIGLIETVIDEHSELVYDLQPEDAVSDGGYLSNLGQAIRLIRECLQQDGGD